MGNLFVIEGLVKPYVVATDTALLRSKGKVLHRSSMKKGVVPRSGIDTDARWGRSRTKGWIFGYKLHMISSTDPLSSVVPYQQMLQQPMYQTNPLTQIQYQAYYQKH